jgi:cobalt-zinc-cadmium efflux system protein
MIYMPGDVAMPHDHHHHDHAPQDFGRAFAIGTALNGGFVVIEVIAGVFAHSMALIADAGHNLGDVLGLVLAWAAATLAKRAPSGRYTYGYRRGTIYASLINAVVLLISVGVIAAGAVDRLINVTTVGAKVMMIVAAIGIAINGVTAFLFSAGRKGAGRRNDLNIRSTFLHMAYDTLLSAGVVVAGALIMLTGWQRLDPVMSLLIALVIVRGMWSLLTSSAAMAMDAVPGDIRPEAVRGFVLALPEVDSVHDLHIWPMSTTETALTLHLVAPNGHPGDAFLARLRHDLHHEFDIDHATVQIETDATKCSLACGSL